jgi:hypothetical protein
MYPTNIAFIHVPKCGGSSVTRAFRVRYALSQATLNEQAAYEAVERIDSNILLEADDSLKHGRLQIQTHAYKRLAFAYLMSRNFKYVKGHVKFDRALYDAYASRYKFVTVLRDPVERYISQYYYDYKRANRNCINESLADFIDTPRGIETGRVYLDYFGETFNRHASDEQSADLAKNNLSLFKVVGFLNQIDAFRRDVKKELDLKIRVGHVNKGAEKNQSLSNELVERIRQRCARDIEIYESALSARVPLCMNAPVSDAPAAGIGATT